MLKQTIQQPIAGIRTTIDVPRVRRAIECVFRRIQSADPQAWERIQERLWGIYWLTDDFRYYFFELPLDSPENWVWGRTLNFDLRLIDQLEKQVSMQMQEALSVTKLLRQGPVGDTPFCAKGGHMLSTFSGRFPDDPQACWVLLSPYVVHLRCRYLRLLVAHELGHVATTAEEFEATNTELQDPTLALEKCANSYLERWFADAGDILRKCLRAGLFGEEPEELLGLHPEEFDASSALRGKPRDWPPKLQRFVQELNRWNRAALREFWSRCPS